MNKLNWLDAKNTLFTVRDWARFGASTFERSKLYYGHGTDNAWDEAVSLILHALKLPHELGDKLIDCRLTELEKNSILELFEKRIVEHIPVPYITKTAHYAGLDFFVDERVLIPRSPIAELIENQFRPWIDPTHVFSILDIGTGSACLAILCALYFPESYVDAVDIDLNALEVARINIDKHHVVDQVSLFESDIFSEIKNQTYDVILSNPPYVDANDMAVLPQEFLHEPQHALASGVDGLLHIKRIIDAAKAHLNPNGILIAEVGNSAEALEAAYPELNFTWLEFERGGEGVFLLTYDQFT